MIKNIIKVGLIVMGVLSFLGIEGCVSIDSRIVNIAKPQLEEKYNTEFEVLSIGNRTDMKTATMIFEDINGIRFTVVVDSETNEVEDDYIRSIIAHKIGGRLKKCFEDSNIDICFRTFVICDDCAQETNTEISLDDFSKQYNLRQIMVYCAIDDSSSTEQSLKSTIENLQGISKEKNIDISCSAFSLDSTSFAECSEKIEKAYDINNTWFDQYNPIKNIVFTVNKDTVNPEIEKIINELG
ncbi:MAG: hypothetical protein IJL63_02050 [Clostridia bacterium]|nr:hypothetical protein [Clostridia bacterium]